MWCYFCVYREVNQIYINVSGSGVFVIHCLGMFKQHLEVKKSIPQKVKDRITVWSSSSTSKYISPKIETKDKNRYLFTHVHSSIIHNS